MTSDLFSEHIIDDFDDGVHNFLSNFYPVPVVVWGVGFPSTEHAFQWFKTNDPKEKEYILWKNIISPGVGVPNGIHTSCGQTKRRGKKVRLRSDWDEPQENGLPLAYTVMLEVVRAKFDQHPDLVDRLLETGDVLIVEGNTCHDNRWGACVCTNCASEEKLNWLGLILMQVRKELRERREMVGKQ